MKPSVPHVELKFTCHFCGLKDHTIYVKPREENADLLKWMEGVKAAIYHVHKQAKPHCNNQTVDLKIHLPKDCKFVGQSEI